MKVYRNGRLEEVDEIRPGDIAIIQPDGDGTMPMGHIHIVEKPKKVVYWESRPRRAGKATRWKEYMKKMGFWDDKPVEENDWEGEAIPWAAEAEARQDHGGEIMSDEEAIEWEELGEEN